ncbi:hypothetical protein Q6A49_00265 [Pseudomonas sp. 22-AL-CL-001]|uniref:hypothetical protein n=1 Tax=Pseudomonas alabamensis TaxID=3064349 RepID=UPI0027135DD8|nr:hypothetical protein [Pseudomonas sp. 22-AL-CL-001]MDO7908980.1 hypothetical protein [Pseudomonas sp. 22-AL-CL-001]
MRPLALFDRVYSWLFPDKRSEWERKRERAFIEAVNKLENYYMTGRGGLSMDPEAVIDYVVARRQELSHLVDPKHRDEPGTNTSSLKAGSFLEVVSWRCLSDEAAMRYVCLQALDGRGYCVASARYFSTEDSPQQDEERRVARRLMGVASELPLEWHPSLEAAIESHERAI